MKITIPSPATGNALIHLGLLAAIFFAISDIALAADSLSQSYQSFTTKGLRLGEPRISPDSEKLVFHQCSRETCEILLLDIATNRFVRIRPLNSLEGKSKSSRIKDVYRNPAFHSNGQQLIVARYRAIERIFGHATNFSFSLVVTDLAGHVRKDISQNKEPKGSPMFLPNTNMVVYVGAAKPHKYAEETEWGATALYVADLDNRQHDKRVGKLAAASLNLSAIDGDGRLLLETVALEPSQSGNRSWNAEFVRVNLKTSSVKQVASGEDVVNCRRSNLRILPDGNLAYIRRTDQIDGMQSSNFSYDFYTSSAAAEVRLTKGLGHIRGMATSSDGQKLAVPVVPQGKNQEEIHVYSRTGKLIMANQTAK